MKSLIISTAAVAALLFSVPASAQVFSGSGSDARSYAANNFHSVNKGNGWLNAPGVVGGVSNSQFKCKDVFAIGTAVASVAIPVDDADCGPIVAAMAWDSCRTAMCQTTLTQNRFIRRSLEAQRAAGLEPVGIQPQRSYLAARPAQKARKARKAR